MRRSLRARAALLLGAAVLIAGATAAAAMSILRRGHRSGTGTCSTAWSIVPTASGTPTNAAFRGLSFDSAVDGWAVTDTGATERWNGTSWSLVAGDSSVIGPSFESVAAVSPTNAWAVGTQGAVGSPRATLIEHWDGTAWHKVASPEPANTLGDTLLSVSAVSATDIWAVGAIDGSDVTVDGVGTAQPLIAHYNGTSWSQVSSFPERSGWHGGLRRVWVVAAHEVWASGAQNFGGSALDQPFTEAWGGTSWIGWGTSDPGAGSRMYGLTADAANDVLAVGIYNPNSSADRAPLEERWDGSRWNTIHFGVSGGTESFLVDAASGGPRSTWAVGQTGPTGGTPSTLIQQWNGSAWNSVGSPDPGTSGFNVMDSIGVAPGGQAFAAGRSTSGPFLVRQCPAAAITVTPPQGEPGSSVTVAGTGFAANETINLVFDSHALATATATGNGTFSKSVTIPASARIGQHTVTATGLTSSASVSSQFTAVVNWSQFHRGSSHAGYNPFETAITSSTASRLAKTWSSPSIGSTDASVAVFNGTLYLGTDTGVLFVLDASNGHKLWQAAGTDTAAEATPAVGRGFVYVGADSGSLQAFGAAGCGHATCAPAWTATVGSGTPSSPALAGGTVYVGGSDGKLYAFDANGTTGCTTGAPITCAPLWTAQTNGGALTNAPAVDGGRVFVHPRDGSIQAFDAAGHTNCSGTPKTCRPLWTNSSPRYGAYSSPAVANGLVYVGAGEGKLYAVKEATGATSWVGTTPRSGHIQSSPAADGNRVYVGSIDHHLYAYPASGCGHASCVPAWSFDAKAAIDSSPAVAGGVVYVVSNTGRVYAVNPSSGAPLASPNCGAPAAPSFEISSPAIVAGTVYQPDPVAAQVCAYTLH